MEIEDDMLSNQNLETPWTPLPQKAVQLDPVEVALFAIHHYQLF